MSTITSISNLKRDILGFRHKNPKFFFIENCFSYFGKAAKKKTSIGLAAGENTWLVFHRNFNLSTSLDLSHRVKENEVRRIFIRQNIDSFLGIITKQ